MTAPSRLVPVVFRGLISAAAVANQLLHTVTPAGALLAPGTARRYTYPFIDAARYGYAHVALNALVLGAAFSALGLALVAADRFRPTPPLAPRPLRENRISSPARGPLK
ncbi:Pr6Pr family membrane protein [Streptomyces sp. NPDC056402]|uniref:Pr6Pr family membrane protein n=1 Tax=Streptomyces sp. NPDC056402 TaxID=3345810 RepID=UPI0035D6A73B